jgi:hypothetical protein
MKNSIFVKAPKSSGGKFCVHSWLQYPKADVPAPQQAKTIQTDKQTFIILFMRHPLYLKKLRTLAFSIHCSLFRAKR